MEPVSPRKTRRAHGDLAQRLRRRCSPGAQRLRSAEARTTTPRRGTADDRRMPVALLVNAVRCMRAILLMAIRLNETVGSGAVKAAFACSRLGAK